MFNLLLSTVKKFIATKDFYLDAYSWMDALREASCLASSLELALYPLDHPAHPEVVETDSVGSVEAAAAAVVVAANVAETSEVHALRPVTEAFWAALDLWRLFAGHPWNPASPFVLIVANCYPLEMVQLERLVGLQEDLVETEGVVADQTYCC